MKLQEFSIISPSLKDKLPVSHAVSADVHIFIFIFPFVLTSFVTQACVRPRTDKKRGPSISKFCSTEWFVELVRFRRLNLARDKWTESVRDEGRLLPSLMRHYPACPRQTFYDSSRRLDR